MSCLMLYTGCFIIPQYKGGNMDFRKLFREFLDLLDWEDEIAVDQDTGECQIATGYTIKGQGYDLYIEGNPENSFLSLWLYPPYKVNEGKSVDAVLLFNYINNNYLYGGSLSLSEKNRIRYALVLDTENAQVDAQLVRNLLASAAGCFRFHAEDIAAVSLTSKTFEAVKADYEHREQVRARREADNS